MNKNNMTALFSLTMLIGLVLLPGAARPGEAAPAATPVAAAPDPAGQQNAGGQQGGAEKQPSWKSRAEYDDFQKIVTAKDPNSRIQAVDAFLQKYPSSDFKDQADVAKMQSYQQLNEAPKAMQAARDALQANADNLGALNYLSFAFPFIFKPTDTDKDAQLSRAEGDAKHGLEVLQKLQKPANVPEDQFNQQVKQLRANFNGALGFVALQRKDYAPAIATLKAAQEDNPSDSYITYRLGLAYLYSSTPDFNDAIWNLARAAALAKAANSADAAAIGKFYTQVYENRHGSDVGERDVLSQASASVAPPQGFNVTPAEKHKPTGNQFIDAFYGYEDSLKAGGDTAQKVWDGLKGQPFGGPGWVANVEKGTEAGTYLVRINIASESKAKDGTYDIELKDSQAGCKDLSKGDPVRFKGTIAAYTATPSFVLTLDNGEINDEDLAAAAASKKGTTKKPAPRHHKP